jgi:AAA+ superfamily predicted ATPase
MAKAKTEMKLTAWETNICALFRSRQPGVVIQSTEERRALGALENILLYLAVGGYGKRDLLVWSNVSFNKIDVIEKNNRDVTTEGHYKPDELQWGELVPTLKKFGDNIGTDKEPTMATLVISDARAQLESPKVERMLRETLWKIRGTFRNIVLLGCGYDLPAHIAPEFFIQKFELPTAQDLQDILTPQIEGYKAAATYKNLVKIDDAATSRFARACAGLTESEARGLLALSIAKFAGLDERAVGMALAEKAHISERSNGVIEYKVITGGLDRVGGLENAKEWIKELDDQIKDEANTKAYGQEMPQGCVLLGIPGCGKSLIGEMLAAHWGLPFLLFDVGRAFGSLVGQSEANIDQVIALTKACAPCVVMIDEMEKALGGGGGEMDGGTSQRVKGKLLTWLQNKPEGVFIVATANDVTKFEASPELLRAGRFDKIFFVDLPDMRSRIEILGIHYKLAVERAKASGLCKLADNIPQEVLIEGAKATKGYSGAELKVIMQTALRATARKKATHPTVEMILTAAKQQRPLSITMAESIARLRNWAKDGRALAAGATLEDDKNDTKAFDDLGLPQLLVNK